MKRLTTVFAIICMAQGLAAAELTNRDRQGLAALVALKSSKNVFNIATIVGGAGLLCSLCFKDALPAKYIALSGKVLVGGLIGEHISIMGCQKSLNMIEEDHQSDFNKRSDDYARLLVGAGLVAVDLYLLSK